MGGWKALGYILGNIIGFAIVFAAIEGASIALVWLVLHLFRLYKIGRLNREMLARMIGVRFDGWQLHWFVGESQIESYGKAPRAFIIVLGIVLVGMVILVVGSLRQPSSDVPYRFQEKADLILIIVFVIGFLAFNIRSMTGIFREPGETFKNKVKDRINHLVSGVNSSLERVEELRSLEASIKSVASQLEISLPIDFQLPIQKFVNAHKIALLADTSELNSMITGLITQAHEYKAQLEKANNLYQAAMQLYRETAHEVNRTESMSLIKQMEYVYLGLDDVRALLPMEKWNDFSDVLNSLMEDLRHLRKTAIKYQEEGYEEYEEEAGETDEQKAYRILGVRPTATDEQIKKLYRKLARIYHKDAGLIGDETRMKEINWAYDILKEIRGFK